MKYYLLVLISLFTVTLHADYNPSAQWGKQFSFKQDAAYIAADKNGNSFIAATTTDSVSPGFRGKQDIVISRLNSAGDVTWSINYGSTDEDYCYTIAADITGNVLVAGKTRGNLGAANTGNFDIFIAKFDSLGILVWQKQFGTSGADAASFMYMDDENNCLVAGSTGGSLAGTSAGLEDIVLLKLNSAGEVIMQAQYGTRSNDQAVAVTEDKEGNCYVLTSAKAFLKFNSSGNMIKNSSCNMYRAWGIAADDSMNVYIGGTGGVSSGSQAVLQKFNAVGNLVWEKKFGSGPWTGINSLVFFKDGSQDILVGGCQNWPACFAYCRRYNSAGDVIWSYSVQDTTNFETCGQKIAIDGLGNCFLSGYTHGNLYGIRVNEKDAFLTKLVITGTSSINKKEYLPGDFKLEQNYPNPFNPATDISYYLPRESNVKILIYNMAGELVNILKDDIQTAGSYVLRWNGDNEKGEQVASGMYICRLETNFKSLQNKMLLIR